MNDIDETARDADVTIEDLLAGAAKNDLFLHSFHQDYNDVWYATWRTGGRNPKYFELVSAPTAFDALQRSLGKALEVIMKTAPPSVIDAF